MKGYRRVNGEQLLAITCIIMGMRNPRVTRIDRHSQTHSASGGCVSSQRSALWTRSGNAETHSAS